MSDLVMEVLEASGSTERDRMITTQQLVNAYIRLHVRAAPNATCALKRIFDGVSSCTLGMGREMMRLSPGLKPCKATRLLSSLGQLHSAATPQHYVVRTMHELA